MSESSGLPRAAGTAAPTGARPRIRHNDYSPLVPPPLGGWAPHLPVSVVIPAYGGQHRLDLTLAALATQTYPPGLMEIIVVDDGSEPPLRLPAIRPEHTRLVSGADGGWGTAHALNSGIRLAEGEIVQRLDSDMVICREHIEALMRWHHLTDYVVTIGAKVFVQEPDLTAAEVYAAVGEGGLDTLFDMESAVPSSTEATIRRLDGLRASRNPYHVCTGPTVSFRRTLFHTVGGLDPNVLRGEDTEFAYRLAMSGAVFVPDMQARAVHLGLPAQRVDKDSTVRVVAPFLAHRVPLRRDLRKERGRTWLVPYAEVVLDVRGAAEAQVGAAVAGALGGSLPDVAVTLVGPWAELPEGRHQVLTDPGFETRLVREQFRYDDRVRLVSAPVPDPAPVPFRYTGPVDVPLDRRSLELMIKAMTENLNGMLVVEFPDGRTARLERTDAVNRARLLAAPGEDLAEVIEQVYGVRRGAASEFWPPAAKDRPAKAPRAQSAAPKDGPGKRDTGEPAGRDTGEPGGHDTGEPAGRDASEGRPGRSAPQPAALVNRLRTAFRGR
ncbi:glycosyltransferase [Sphaerisporangium corydalis]|uniref:Glycosyltransferase n=1 Tax=Sphaerisporangium corydalis TaxID=1441875 RepID=A0ABV9EIF9_9ACTN|nr:glycosyltransferase [Sphaerisporangium corydalis]